MSKHTFKHTRLLGGREVSFEIDIDLDGLALDRGQAAINARTRKTTLCGGAIVVRAVKIGEGAMTTYRGWIDWKDGPRVQRIADRGRRSPLPLRLDLDNHSPTGFAWGSGGSGPAQLALALLADALGDDDEAQRLHMRFKRRVTARLAIDEGWTMTRAEILEQADAIRAEVLAEEARRGDATS